VISTAPPTDQAKNRSTDKDDKQQEPKKEDQNDPDDLKQKHGRDSVWLPAPDLGRDVTQQLSPEYPPSSVGTQQNSQPGSETLQGLIAFQG
jgi:hypothetical protein